MIWILGYLAIGLGLSLRLPVLRLRTLEKANNIPPERWAAMTANERASFEYLLDSVRDPYRSWQLVLAGLLWPLQIIGWIVADVFSRRIRRRIEANHSCRVCRCPGCAQNLVTSEGTDVVEDPQSDLVRFVCGVCGSGSEWDMGPPVPIFIRTVTTVPLASSGSSKSP
jgi:hypothetical protein